MQKLLLSFILFLCIACDHPSQKPASSENGPLIDMSPSSHSPAFDRSLNLLMEAYFNLKDGFTEEDTAAISGSSLALKLAADSLVWSELKADSNLISTARTYADGISSEVLGLLGEQDLHAKRLSFQMISDQVYDLIRTVQYHQQVLYHFYCARAFEDQGAYWISAGLQSKNPYQPLKDGDCAVIRDTIRFRAGN